MIKIVYYSSCTVTVNVQDVNPLTPNDPYSGRTAPLTSKRSILYIYSTNICTEYFKHGIYSPFFSLRNAVCFIILKYLVPLLIHILYTGCAKIKKNSGAKRLLQLEFTRKIFEKYSNCEFHENPSTWGPEFFLDGGRTDEQTAMTKLKISFRNFAKAPQKQETCQGKTMGFLIPFVLLGCWLEMG